MTIYLLNTPIMTAYGQWRFEGPISNDAARGLLVDGFVSAVGHDGSALFLSKLLDREVAVARISIKMEPGDRALVLRLKGRLPEGRVLTAEEMAEFPFELGLLERLV